MNTANASSPVRRNGERKRRYQSMQEEVRAEPNQSTCDEDTAALIMSLARNEQPNATAHRAADTVQMSSQTLQEDEYAHIRRKLDEIKKLLQIVIARSNSGWQVQPPEVQAVLANLSGEPVESLAAAAEGVFDVRPMVTNSGINETSTQPSGTSLAQSTTRGWDEKRWLRLPSLAKISAVQLWVNYKEGGILHPPYEVLERDGTSWRNQPGTKGRGRRLWLEIKQVLQKVQAIAQEKFNGDCKLAARHMDELRGNKSLSTYYRNNIKGNAGLPV